VNLEMLIKTASNDWAAQAQVPPGLADRVLRRSDRRRHLKVGLAAGATVLMVGTAVGVVSVTGPTQRSSPTVIQSGSLSKDTSLRTDLGNSFPRSLVAAGHTAVAAYYTNHMVPTQNDSQRRVRTWHLYNPTTGQYEKTSWTYLDVAPGLYQAAVLEGPLPASRVGILDMKTQKVIRWINVDHPVAAVAWAPDGRRLVLTAYDKDPDTLPSDENGQSTVLLGSSGFRTGFYIVDAESKLSSFHRLAGDNEVNNRQDFGWSRSGTLLSTPTSTSPTKAFYDLNGNPQPAPPHEDETNDGEAGLSPNGTLLPKFGPSPGPAVTVTNVKTGKIKAILPIEQAAAWADDKQLFVIGCDPKNCTGKGEFRNRLLLVGLDGKITPLTGYRRSDLEGAWVPVFTHR
jgi:hypothetical protein